LPSTFLLLHLTEDWLSENMAIVTNKRKVLSAKGKLKLIKEIQKRKKES
jgi:hypothetical protein